MTGDEVRGWSAIRVTFNSTFPIKAQARNCYNPRHLNDPRGMIDEGRGRRADFDEGRPMNVLSPRCHRYTPCVSL